METLQEQVKGICKLADAIIKNPSQGIDKAAERLNLPKTVVAFAAGGLLCPGSFGIAGLAVAIWKKITDKKREQEEKERMLREVIRKQDAVIHELEKENAKNKQEIENLKRMLDMLKETEEIIKAA